MLCNFSFPFIYLSFHSLSQEHHLLRSHGLHWCKITGNFTEEMALLFSFFIHLLLFCPNKHICILKSTAPANCAFYWLSSIKGLFESSLSLEGKTEKSKPPSFIPLGILSKITLSQWMHPTPSLLTYWLCVKFFSGFICQSGHILHDCHVKNILWLLTLYSEFSLQIFCSWQQWFCDTWRNVMILLLNIMKLILIGICNLLRSQGT